MQKSSSQQAQLTQQSYKSSYPLSSNKPEPKEQLSQLFPQHGQAKQSSASIFKQQMIQQRDFNQAPLKMTDSRKFKAISNIFRDTLKIFSAKYSSSRLDQSVIDNPYAQHSRPNDYLKKEKEFNKIRKNPLGAEKKLVEIYALRFANCGEHAKIFHAICINLFEDYNKAHPLEKLDVTAVGIEAVPNSGDHIFVAVTLKEANSTTKNLTVFIDIWAQKMLSFDGAELQLTQFDSVSNKIGSKSILAEHDLTKVTSLVKLFDNGPTKGKFNYDASVLISTLMQFATKGPYTQANTQWQLSNLPQKYPPELQAKIKNQNLPSITKLCFQSTHLASVVSAAKDYMANYLKTCADSPELTTKTEKIFELSKLVTTLDLMIKVTHKSIEAKDNQWHGAEQWLHKLTSKFQALINPANIDHYAGIQLLISQLADAISTAKNQAQSSSLTSQVQKIDLAEDNHTQPIKVVTYKLTSNGIEKVLPSIHEITQPITAAVNDLEKAFILMIKNELTSAPANNFKQLHALAGLKLKEAQQQLSQIAEVTQEFDSSSQDEQAKHKLAQLNKLSPFIAAEVVFYQQMLDIAQNLPNLKISGLIEARENLIQNKDDYLGAVHPKRAPVFATYIDNIAAILTRKIAE